jgi:hypothetical protein
MNMKLLFRWYDLWVGLYIDTKRKILYIFPIPMIGIAINYKKIHRDWEFECVEFQQGEAEHTANCDTDGHYLCNICRWNKSRNVD